MKIVVITNHGSDFGKRLLNRLKHDDHHVDSVVLVQQPIGYHWKLFRYVQRRVGLLDTVYFTIKQLF